MTGEFKAVFLSYASEDLDAAQRIADALKAAGIQVWFDKSELRGGEAWDRKIRERIRTCALFIPVISANAHARIEGYFRLEWKLAIDRSHLIAPDQTFLLPIAVDGTPHTDERIPERFRELQWMRLSDGAATPAFVERIQRLLAGVTASTPEHSRAPPAAAATDAPVPAAGAVAGSHRRRRLAYAVIAALALISLGYFALERQSGSKPRARAVATIAILPLANESGDPSQQYFSDGISEDLITTLSQFPGLKVIGRTSSFQFRDSKEDSRSIGAKLGVAHLLEGSVRRSAETVRVSAELIDTADGSTQWSERYDRPYKDLFALQDEITYAVVRALRTKLVLADRAVAQSERPPSGNLDAYAALLQGRFYMNKHNEGGFRKAIDSFTTAAQLDSHYALASSDLSRALRALAENYLGGSAAEQIYAKAYAAADRALALDPDLAAAHVAKGYLLQTAGFDTRSAMTEFERAIQLAPEDLETNFALGNGFATIGRVERAVELTRRVLAADPMNARRLNWMASYLMALGRLDEAEQAARRAIELSPDSDSFAAMLTAIAVQRGDARAAIAAAEQSPAGTWRTIALALAYQIGSDRVAADAALKTLITTQGDASAYQVADAYALRNDVDKTFEWLERAWTVRDPGILGLLFDPFMARYRADPRFAVYCHKVGLPAPAEIA